MSWPSRGFLGRHCRGTSGDLTFFGGLVGAALSNFGIMLEHLGPSGSFLTTPKQPEDNPRRPQETRSETKTAPRDPKNFQKIRKGYLGSFWQRLGAVLGLFGGPYWGHFELYIGVVLGFIFGSVFKHLFDKFWG